ncbi:hypothetical protein KSF_107120 [Reticulibacter mediterranei]|uniref:Uncharacterized protein n=1 Tax=Reticulibacter mediterranei TaxID=2778369 RepID=A0A8J3IRG7_9CHLR|nr:hypothetical protein [Reticulibacter mediterranei]GHP00665.1 hypothetical protein KSF_107120 [Reticulibacter mediterranei]
MSGPPFCANQFTSTAFDSHEEKAKWANAMASWIRRGFPKNGWRKGLYEPLHTNLYGHIAHFDLHGFYAEWFADIHQQLQWLQYAAKGGAFGGGRGDPAYTWSDVERALSAWIRGSGLIERYQQRCAQEIEAKERALLSHLQQKYTTEQPVITAASAPEKPPTTKKGKKEEADTKYVRFSLFEECV